MRKIILLVALLATPAMAMSPGWTEAKPPRPHCKAGYHLVCTIVNVCTCAVDEPTVFSPG